MSLESHRMEPQLRSFSEWFTTLEYIPKVLLFYAIHVSFLNFWNAIFAENCQLEILLISKMIHKFCFILWKLKF